MRKNLYADNSANYPRLATDACFADYSNECCYSGFIDKMIRYIEDFQLLNEELWQRFVRQFRGDADYDAAWRGEYWGKMMRGACLTYSYTRNEKLYSILTATINDLIEHQESSDRISSYGEAHEFDGWDIWGRKYVLLGMQYFIEICREAELEQRIIRSMCRQADYIISKIGRKEDGKMPITSATRHCVSACS